MAQSVFSCNKTKWKFMDQSKSLDKFQGETSS